jgi:hypothetical protein
MIGDRIVVLDRGRLAACEGFSSKGNVAAVRDFYFSVSPEPSATRGMAEATK